MARRREIGERERAAGFDLRGLVGEPGIPTTDRIGNQSVGLAALEIVEGKGALRAALLVPGTVPAILPTRRAGYRFAGSRAFGSPHGQRAVAHWALSPAALSG